MIPLLAALVALVAAPQTALVQTNGARPPLLLVQAGEELVPELHLWRVPATVVPGLRHAAVVRLSRPERLFKTAAQLQATDPLVGLQWWRGAVGADSVAAPGPGKPLTIVDSGVDMSHPEFAGRPNTTVLNEQTTSEEDEGHGTEVSSVAAAPNNGVGLVGIYPEAVLRIWDASPFGFLSEGAAIQGIVEAARRGPGVINLSFGGEDDDALLEEAILLAVRAGSIVVAAAGNEGLEGSPPNFPASYSHVLTVGASNESGHVASFSTISPTVDLVAPGVRIPVAEPTWEDEFGYSLGENGTSFSAPLVSGATAWVWTRRPELDNTQLFEIMRRSATDIAEPGFDNAAGYGLLNVPAALSFPAPPRDPQEPNEQPDQIEPQRLFPSGAAPLTRPGQTTASLAARVDRSEDPRDLYRIWAPGGMVTRARVTGPVALRLLTRTPRAVTSRPLAVAKGGVAAYRNRAKRGTYVYVEIRPAAAARTADYTLRLTAARR